MEGSVVTMQDIFLFQQTGVGDDGRIQGSFVATGVRPKFLGRLARNGIEFPREYFRFKMDV
jgi:pilus assembly protein CpaF